MGDLIQGASSILTQAERRVEVSAQNVANVTTPGYKRRVSFERLISNDQTGDAPTTEHVLGVDFSVGNTASTGQVFDLAISGEGFFVVRAPDGFRYTRAGQFHRNADGLLVTAQGFAVQGRGGDVALKTDAVKVEADGTILDNGDARDRLALVRIADLKGAVAMEAGLFSAPDDQVTPMADVTVKQGMLESSNVSTADEMIAIMSAVRQAQAGQHLINVYDDLMGRAISTFGQSG
jgi:flagellar basal-body rod protein FlgG